MSDALLVTDLSVVSFLIRRFIKASRSRTKSKNIKGLKIFLRKRESRYLFNK